MTQQTTRIPIKELGWGFRTWDRTLDMGYFI